MLHLLAMIGASLLLVGGMMTMLWVIYVYTKNAGIVDIGWALGFVLTALAFMILGDGSPLRKFFMFTLISLWALRLAWYLYSRFSIRQEDPRYKEIRGKWSGAVDLKVLLLFLFQAVLLVFVAFPFAFVFNNPDPHLHPIELIGAVIWASALAGESLSDYQLHVFKMNPANRGKVCQDGFWFYSRHPNYFFEWLIWVAYFVIALGSPNGWIAIISPLIMLYCLLRLSGIPTTEAQAIRTKGELYREYQRTTNAFFPWFKRV